MVEHGLAWEVGQLVSCLSLERYQGVCMALGKWLQLFGVGAISSNYQKEISDQSTEAIGHEHQVGTGITEPLSLSFPGNCQSLLRRKVL